MNSSSEPTPITSNALESIEVIDMKEASIACDGLVLSH